jgi:hypothetical protein
MRGTCPQALEEVSLKVFQMRRQSDGENGNMMARSGQQGSSKKISPMTTISL